MSGWLRTRLGRAEAEVEPFQPPMDDPATVEEEWEGWGRALERFVAEGRREAFREMWTRAGPSDVWKDRSRKAVLAAASAGVSLGCVEFLPDATTRAVLARLLAVSVGPGEIDLSQLTDAELDELHALLAGKLEEAAAPEAEVAKVEAKRPTPHRPPFDGPTPCRSRE